MPISRPRTISTAQFLLARALLLACILAVSAAVAMPARAAAFQRGVNLSHWLQFQGRQPVGAEDMAAIAAAGFDHVRIPFDPIYLGWSPASADTAQPLPKIKQLDDAVEMALRANLAVIVDFHPGASTSERIESDPEVRRAYVALWSWLAARYAAHPADKVAFEVLNEPQYYRRGATPWNALQKDVVAAIRAVAPGNLLLLSGIHGSDIDVLDRTAIIDDPNVRYVFHFYEPTLLTHMGADWDPYDKKPEGMVRGLVYPATEMSLGKTAIRAGGDITLVAEAVRKYLDQGWDSARVRARIGVAQQWADRNHLRLFATEFGTLRAAVDPQSRARWLSDVRSALEAGHMSWTIWDYADLFGIATTKGAVYFLPDGTPAPSDMARATRTLDPAMLQALGLTK